MIMFGAHPSVTTESASKSYSKKRKLEPKMQTSEKAAMSPRKKKNPSTPVASKEMAPESIADGRMLTPPSVRIAALETLEILLNVVLNLTYFHHPIIFASILL